MNAPSLENVRLSEYAGKVLIDFCQHESLGGDEKGNTYRLRVRPSRIINNVIDASVTFLDTSKQKKLTGGP